MIRTRQAVFFYLPIRCGWSHAGQFSLRGQLNRRWATKTVIYFISIKGTIYGRTQNYGFIEKKTKVVLYRKSKSKKQLVVEEWLGIKAEL
jgi:hypothetical protein